MLGATTETMGGLAASANEGRKETVALVKAKAYAFMGVCSRALCRVREFRLELSPSARQKALTFCLVGIVGLGLSVGVFLVPSGGSSEVQAQIGATTPVPTSTLIPIPPTPTPGVCGDGVIGDDEECDPPGSINPNDPRVKCSSTCIWLDNFVFLPKVVKNYSRVSRSHGPR